MSSAEINHIAINALVCAIGAGILMAFFNLMWGEKTVDPSAAALFGGLVGTAIGLVTISDANPSDGV